jgi:predicted DsbA family dithiol-disulfide isomerase
VESHPETPPEGIPMTSRFRAEDIERMMGHLRTMGAPFGIAFVDRPLLSNSRAALLAAEFSREQGKLQAFHEGVFAAYFSHGLDIGDVDVLRQIASDIGLDANVLAGTVKSGKHVPLLEKTKEQAARLGVTGVPACFIDDKKAFVGAQPLDVFRKALASMKG